MMAKYPPKTNNIVSHSGIHPPRPLFLYVETQFPSKGDKLFSPGGHVFSHAASLVLAGGGPLQ
jgi:hypothetical protein